MNATMEKLTHLVKMIAEHNPKRAASISVVLPVIESKGLAKIAKVFNQEDLESNLWEILSVLIDSRDEKIRGNHTPAFLRIQAEKWRRTQEEADIALRILREYADKSEVRTDPSCDCMRNAKPHQLTTRPEVTRQLATEIEYWFSNDSPNPAKFLGKKGGFNEYVIRNIASRIPQFNGRDAAIAEIMTLVGFKISRQLVNTTLREAMRPGRIPKG